jgi:uncharacterized protein YjdB
VATVSYNGLNATVTGIAAGTATITVTVTNYDGSKKTNTCTVTVQSIAVTGVSLSPTTLTLPEGQTYTLSASVSPNTATNKTVTWSSNNASVVSVTTGGTIKAQTGKKGQTAVITVTTQDGGKTATCTVTVIPVAVTGITLSSTSLDFSSYVNLVNLESAAKTLTATVSPSNAENKAITWSSSNTNVAAISDAVTTATASGKATAKITPVSGSGGTATITVTTQDGGYSATCTVKVPPILQSITLSPSIILGQDEDKGQTNINVITNPLSVSNIRITIRITGLWRIKDGVFEEYLSKSGLSSYVFSESTNINGTALHFDINDAGKRFSVGQPAMPYYMYGIFEVTVRDPVTQREATAQGIYNRGPPTGWPETPWNN